MTALLIHIQAICSIGNRLKVLFVLVSLFCFLTISSFASQEEFAVLPVPVISSENFPCTRCHKQSGTAPGVHKKIFHITITVEGHTEDSYGCFKCHDREDRDKLQLFSNSKIDITESSELCGQCHSTNYKLWASGLHGKVWGKWNGPKKITPCTTCHDPHRPGYKDRKPEPPPVPPEQTLRWRK